MPSEFSAVQGRLDRACCELLQKDIRLFEFDVNERTLTQRLSLYLQSEFREHKVDCEYNRSIDEPKKMFVEPEGTRSDDTKAVTVYPDIVVHQRGMHESNLLVVEAKKNATDPVPYHDAAKLRGFTNQAGNFRYEWGAFLNFQIVAGRPTFTITWFWHGHQLSGDEIRLAEQAALKELGDGE